MDDCVQSCRYSLINRPSNQVHRHTLNKQAGTKESSYLTPNHPLTRKESSRRSLLTAIHSAHTHSLVVSGHTHTCPLTSTPLTGGVRSHTHMSTHINTTHWWCQVTHTHVYSHQHCSLVVPGLSGESGGRYLR